MGATTRPVSRAVVGLMLLVAVAGCSDQADTPLRSPASDPATSPSVDPFALLRRPWAHPPVAPGSACPVTTDVQRPDRAIGPLLGAGPARPARLGTGAVLEYVAAEGGWRDRSRGGQKVMWAVDPAVDVPVLVRGRRLDGPGDLAFEDPAEPELRIAPGFHEGQPGANLHGIVIIRSLVPRSSAGVGSRSQRRRNRLKNSCA
jgi:hypothetical protein